MKLLASLLLFFAGWSAQAQEVVENNANIDSTYRYVALLGSTTLNYLGDSDHITVHSCQRMDAEATQLKVRVVSGSAHLQYFRVTFANGEHQTLDIRNHFSRGSESRWVDLRGRTRCISDIQVIGRSDLRLTKAQVQVWGYMSRHY